MNDVVKVTVWVDTDKVGSRCEDTIEIEKDVWESMTEDQKQEELQEVVWNMCEWGWEVED